MMNDAYFMGEALKEAQKSLSQGGIPIGAVIVFNNEIISRGHNRLIQNDSLILHGEMDAIENVESSDVKYLKESTLYTTLSPCPMCSGAIILYNIPRVVIGENKTLMGAENLLKSNNVEVRVLNDSKSRELFLQFLKEKPEIWQKELGKVGNSTEVK